LFNGWMEGQRLMLAEFLEHQHRQQARSRPAAGRDVERRRRLADLLAIPAAEFFADVLDHLPTVNRLALGPRFGVGVPLATAVKSTTFLRDPAPKGVPLSSLFTSMAVGIRRRKQPGAVRDGPTCGQPSFRVSEIRASPPITSGKPMTNSSTLSLTQSAARSFDAKA
jgi:hypothetical protein